MYIPFNRPHMTGKELWYIAQAHHNSVLAGNGLFTKRCQSWLETLNGARALLTHSCTAALEMSALLAGLGAGDEVIMPSFTFVSTANAFVLRGATPVFVDIRPDTLNLDETRIEAAIIDKTWAIVVVHYAGVACAMDPILTLADHHGLIVIEDAAQAVMSRYRGRPLGTLGHFGAYSFHETKNIISGEGGALLVNRERDIDRAEIIWEKGTNRCRFFRGEVDKYSWQDVGSSFQPGEIIAAFLWAQMEEAERITKRRLALWHRYDNGLQSLELAEKLRRPIIPETCQHNAHMYYVILPDAHTRDRVMAGLKERNIHALFHFIPLHDAPAGRRFGRTPVPLPITLSMSERLLRLPFFHDMTDEMIDRVVEAVSALLA